MHLRHAPRRRQQQQQQRVTSVCAAAVHRTTSTSLMTHLLIQVLLQVGLLIHVGLLTQQVRGRLRPTTEASRADIAVMKTMTAATVAAATALGFSAPPADCETTNTRP